jgi:hypothetical protein
VLREHVADWFELDDDVHVTHVDGTGYYRLIHRFCERTGVPMVLNTSFNDNEPIVCTPRQALDCFLRTRIGLQAVRAAVAMVSPAGSTGTGSPPGPASPRLRAELFSPYRSIDSGAGSAECPLALPFLCFYAHKSQSRLPSVARAERRPLNRPAGQGRDGGDSPQWPRYG